MTVEWSEGIAAIEAEAVDARNAEIAEAVRGLRGVDWEYRDGWHNMVDRAAVLAIVNGEPE